MVHQAVTFVFAFLLVAVYAGPLRRRRQVPASTTFNIPCPVKCSWSTSQAWAKLTSFDKPSANLYPEEINSDKNDTFSLMCSLYESTRLCWKGCAISRDSDIAAYNSSLPVQQVCGERQSEFDQYVPCLTRNATIFQRACQNENADFLAATVRLTTQLKPDPESVLQYCRTANVQAYCVFPILRQTCGDGPYNALRWIMNASLVGIRASIGDPAIEAFYPTCAQYFHTIENGIRPSGTGNDKAISSTTDPLNTTVAFDSTTANYSTNSTSIRRDDPIRSSTTGFRQIDPRRGDQTTPSSAGTAIRYCNIFVFLMISVLFRSL